MPGKGVEYAYINPVRSRTLLETPSGFALFDVDDDALKEANDTWVYFRDVATAKNVMFALGFVKFSDKTIAWDGQTRPSKELIRLIRRYCKGTKPLIVQSAVLLDVIEKKLNIKCSYNEIFADEVVWGIKNVLHEFIPEEKDNITMEYRLPVSKGLELCLKGHLINVSPTTMLNADFISEIGLLHYLNITLEQVPRTLRDSYDEHVCRIGEHIKNNWMYAKVLARILVPELAPKYDFSKMFSPDLARKIQEADESATKYRDEQLTMDDRLIIMGAFSTLLSVPKQRDDIMFRIKLMEAELHRKEMMLKDPHHQFMREPMNLKHSAFRRTLLETPSGFAIFDVNEDVFKRPLRIWTRFTDEVEAHEIVLALGFVKVHDKSIARSSCGPGKELTSLILKLSAHNTKLIVQDDALKSVIEEKLMVKCCTNFSNDNESLGDLMWGLKNVLHEFIPYEMDNLTQEYYLPMSKGLQNALKSYGVSVSPEQMDRKFLYFLGYLSHLDWTSSLLPIILRKMFDRHVCRIGELIKDDVLYAKVIGQILVPESVIQFDFNELLPSDLAEKIAEATKHVETSKKYISGHDKRVILAVRDYLSFVHENRECYLRFLKYRDSDSEELPRIDEFDVDLVNFWLMSVTKASMSDKLVVDVPDGVPSQTGDAHQGDAEVSKSGEKSEKTALEVEKTALEVEKTDPEVRRTTLEVEKTKGKNNSSKTNEMDALGNFVDEQKNGKPIVDPTPRCSIGDEDKKQTEAAVEDLSSDENSTQQGTYDTRNKEKNADTTLGHASNETEVAQNTNVVIEGTPKDTASEEIRAMESTEDANGASHNEGATLHNTDNDGRTYEQTLTDTASHKFSLVTSTSSIQERKYEETSADVTSHKKNVAHITDNIVEENDREHIVDPTPGISTKCSIGAFIEDKKQSEATMEDPSSGENGTLQSRDDTENEEQNADATTCPASYEKEVALIKNVIIEGSVKDTTSKETSTIKGTEDAAVVEDSVNLCLPPRHPPAVVCLPPRHPPEVVCLPPRHPPAVVSLPSVTSLSNVVTPRRTQLRRRMTIKGTEDAKDAESSVNLGLPPRPPSSVVSLPSVTSLANVVTSRSPSQLRRSPRLTIKGTEGVKDAESSVNLGLPPRPPSTEVCFSCVTSLANVVTPLSTSQRRSPRLNKQVSTSQLRRSPRLYKQDGSQHSQLVHTPKKRKTMGDPAHLTEPAADQALPNTSKPTDEKRCSSIKML